VGNEFKDLFGDWQPGDERSIPPRNEGDPLSGEPENRTPRALNEKEVRILGVFEHTLELNPNSAGSQTFVLLQDNLGRRVPIFIGRPEAFAISMAMESEELDRPMTYDLMKLVIDRLGANVERVVIDDLWQDIFYAKITVARNGDIHDIDCRPSDALNIALRYRAPIYMAEAVIESIEQKY
jgi:bifunctional DNase/RNase